MRPHPGPLPARPETRRAALIAARLSLAVSCSVATTHDGVAAPPQQSRAGGPAEATAARADFGGVAPRAVIRRLADWVVRHGDNQGGRFALVDKEAATLYVFDAQGLLQARSPVLLGLARGDRSVPGIGERTLAQIAPDERTTPAGRFRLEAGRNLQGSDILWVDYEHAVSMHPVHSVNRGERRLERLATRTPADNRISYGCINVPAAFYRRWLGEGFAGAVLYILPEELAITSVFPLE